MGRLASAYVALAWALAAGPAFAQGAAPSAPAAAQPGAATPSAQPAAAAPRFSIDGYDVSGNTLLTQDQIERAVYPFLGPDHTTDDVEQARAALEQAYHAHGYQSVFVEIPQQSAFAGILKLQVTEAKIASVSVTGETHRSAESIARRIPALQVGDVPNLDVAQAQITEANRQPGLQITPLLKPGKVPGTIDVELKAEDKRPIKAFVQLTNDHSPNTVPLRLTASLSDTDLWGLGHTISATYVVAPQKRSDTEVFAGSYLAPIWGSPWSVLLYGYHSNSNIAALGGTNVLGKGYAVGLRGLLTLPSSGNLSQSVNFGVDYKDFQETISVGSAGSISSPIRYFPLVGSYSLLRATDADTLNLTMGFTAGLRGLGSDEIDYQTKRFDASSSFVHFNLDADYTRQLPKGFAGVIRVSGQVADGPLVSNEQFSVGGLTSVRGYLQSESVGDDGIVGAIELRSPSLAFADFVDELRLYGFTDAGFTHLRQPLPEQIGTDTLWSAGVGGRVRLFNVLTGEIAVGFPLLAGTRGKDPFASFSIRADY